jgi:spore coat polysaccharide biosynthesis predicted glycosyltransferase SpsG/ribosomal protein S18 acetylase RimI-like enzyme
MGVGHVIRSLALAEAAVVAGHDVVVAGHFEGSFVQGQLAAAPVEVVQLAAPLADHDLQPVIELVSDRRPDVLHVDSYEAPARLHELVAPPEAEAERRGVVLSNMEDGGFGRRPADVVVDPTLGAQLLPRPDDGSTWLLRGSRYAPMRQRVIDARRAREVATAVEIGPAGEIGMAAADSTRTVLVVMGGTDPVGLAPAAVGLLARAGLALTVTAIAVGKNAERVRAAARDSALSLTVLAPVDDLAALMSAQDLVISAAGTSVWELCCIGVPMALIWAVDNQRDGYDRVVAAGAALGLGGPELGGPELGGPVGRPELGEAELGGPELQRDERAVGPLRRALTDSRMRADLAQTGRDVVDGLGAWRVVRTWEQALRLGSTARPASTVHPSSTVHASPTGNESPAPLTARPAGMQDARRLWEWRNDPATRASSRSSAEIAWDDHVRWLTASLARSDRVLLLAEDPVGPVGTVRWDRQGEGEWEVSITVAPQRRGQSLARPLLRAGELALSKAALSEGTAPSGTGSSGTEVTAYLAVVHVDNAASVRLFESSAYVPDLPSDPRGFMRFRKVAPVA